MRCEKFEKIYKERNYQIRLKTVKNKALTFSYMPTEHDDEGNVQFDLLLEAQSYVMSEISVKPPFKKNAGGRQIFCFVCCHFPSSLTSQFP